MIHSYLQRWIFFFVCLCVQFVYAGDADIVLKPYLPGLPDNRYTVDVFFVASGNKKILTVPPLIDQQFENGQATLVLKQLDRDALVTANVRAVVQINSEARAVTLNFNTSSYTTRAYRAYDVYAPVASELIPTTSFTQVFSATKGFDFGDIVIQQTLPIFTASRNFDVAATVGLTGTVHVSGAYYQQGTLLEKKLNWKLGPQNGIYSLNKVAIGKEGEAGHALDIDGAIRTQRLLLNGDVILLDNKWYYNDAQQLYYSDGHTINTVGFGTNGQHDARLDIAGGILFSDTSYTTTDPGVMYYDNDLKKFRGMVVGQLEGATLLPLGSTFNTTTKTNTLTRLISQNELGYTPVSIKAQSQTTASVQILGPNSVLHLNAAQDDRLQFATVLSAGSFQNQVLSVAASGNVGVGVDPTQSGYMLDVKGTLNASDILITRTNFLGNFLFNNSDIYYDLGNVSIGQSAPLSNLEIASPDPEKNADFALVDPAITFSHGPNKQTQFTVGIDQDAKQTFLIESERTLGEGKPLLALSGANFGLGIRMPESNFHVSGNKGLLYEGDFSYFNEGFDLSIVEPLTVSGSRFVFNPYNASFRADFTVADEHRLPNVGLHSVGFGSKNMIPGERSSALSGSGHSIAGIYSVVPNGASNVVGPNVYASVAMGAGAQALHRGSFILAQAGALTTALPDQPIIQAANAFTTTQPNQFLIGALPDSYLDATVGINTNEGDGALSARIKGLSSAFFQDTLSLSKAQSDTLLQHLISTNILTNQNGYITLAVPEQLILKDTYAYPKLGIIVSINAREVLATVLATARTDTTFITEAQQTDQSNYERFATTFLPISQWMAHYSYDGSVATTDAKMVYDQFVDDQLVTHADSVFEKLTASLLLEPDGAYSDRFVQYCEASFSNGSFVNNYVVQLGFNTYIDPEISAFSQIDLIAIINNDVNVLEIDTRDQCNALATEKITLADIRAAVAASDFVDSAQCNASQTGLQTQQCTIFNAYYSPGIYNNTLTAVVFQSDIARVIYAALDDLLSFEQFVMVPTYKDKPFLISDLTVPASILGVNAQGALRQYVEDVLTQYGRSTILKLEGDQKQPVFTVNANRFVGIGYTESTVAQLAVSGAMQLSADSVSTIDSKLAIFNPSTSSALPQQPYSFRVSDQQRAASLVSLDAHGTWAIGGDPGVYPTTGRIITEDYKLMVYGSIKANGLQNSSTGETLSLEDPVLVFSKLQDGRTYFVSGNVGVHTDKPNTLLHLAYNPNFTVTVAPTIVFDYNGLDVFEMGYRDSGKFSFWTPGSGETVPLLERFLGYTAGNTEGENERTLKGHLGVSDRLLILTTNATAALAVPDLKVESLVVWSPQANRYQPVSASGWSWDVNALNQPFIQNINVGLGTENASVSLVVSGNIKATKTRIADTLFIPKATLNKPLLLRAGIVGRSIPLTVANGELLLGQKTVSNGLYRGNKSRIEWGGVALFLADDQLVADAGDFLSFSFSDEATATTDFWYYEQDLATWNVAANALVTPSGIVRLKGGLNVVANVPSYNQQFLLSNSRSASLVHNVVLIPSENQVFNYFEDSFPYKAISLNMYLNQANSATGIAVSMKTIGEQTTLIHDTKVVGLLADVSNVLRQGEADERTRGYKYPALFFGDVSIGQGASRNLDELLPGVPLLAVSGNIQSSGLSISQRLILSNLSVANFGKTSRGFFVDSGKVAIGTPIGSAALEIGGSILATGLKTTFLDAKLADPSTTSTLRVGATFTVEPDFVGFGTTDNPGNSRVLFKRTIQESLPHPVVYKRYNIAHEESVLGDISLQTIAIKTMPNNTLGAPGFPVTVMGLNIDLSSVELAGNQAQLVGLTVTASPQLRTSYRAFGLPTANAAVFKGGSVYVGEHTLDTTIPSATHLYVNGDITAHRFDSDGFLSQTLNYTVKNKLNVNGNTVIDGNMEASMVYVGKLRYTDIKLDDLDLVNYQLVIQDRMNVTESVELQESLIFTTATVNKLVATSGFMMRMATSNFFTDTLSTRLSLTADRAQLVRSLSVPQLTSDRLRVGNTFFTYNARNAELAQAYPMSIDMPVVVQTAFNENNPHSWNALVLTHKGTSDKQATGIVLDPFVAPLPQDGTIAWGVYSHRVASENQDVAMDLNFRQLHKTADSKNAVTISTNGSVVVKPQLGVIADALFTANGTAYFNNMVIASSLRVPRLQVPNTLTVRSDAVFPGQVTFTNASADKPVHMVSSNYQALTQNGVSFYYDRNDGGFYMQHHDGDRIASRNILSSLLLNENQGVYFDQNSELLSMPLEITNSELKAQQVTMQYHSRLSTTDLVNESASVRLKSVRVSVNTRVKTAPYLTGFSLNIVSQNETVSDEDEGDLIGLSVDVKDLVVDQNNATAQKIAGLFQGGSVAITSANLYTLPVTSAAQLWVSSANKKALFSVTQEGQSLMQVMATENVAFGFNKKPLNPAMMMVQSQENRVDFVIKNSANAPVLSVNNGIVIGQDAAIAAADTGVYVQETIQATSVRIPTLNTGSFLLADPNLVAFDVAKQRLGLGIATPESQVHAVVRFTNNDAVPRVGEGIRKAIVQTLTGKVSQSLVGFEYQAKTQLNNFVKGPDVAIKALEVDMRQLVLNPMGNQNPAGKAYGVYVEPTANQAAAVFVGNTPVGIGRLPADGYMLDINGNLSVSDLDIPVTATNFQPNEITVNSSLIVTTNMTVTGEIQTSQIGQTSVRVTDRLSYANDSIIKCITYDAGDCLNAADISNQALLDSVGSNLEIKTLIVTNNMAVVSGDRRVTVQIGARNETNIVMAVSGLNSWVDQLRVPTAAIVSLEHASSAIQIGSDIIVNEDRLVSANAIKVDRLRFKPGFIGEKGLYWKDNELYFNQALFSTLYKSTIPGAIPYLGPAGLAFTESLKVITANQTIPHDRLRITRSLAGTGQSHQPALQAIVTINADSIFNNFEVQTVSLAIAKRPLSSTQYFTGMLVSFNALQAPQITDIQDHYVGVSVNLSSLVGEYATQAGESRQTTKIAAIFQGGQVLIRPSGNYQSNDLIDNSGEIVNKARLYVNSTLTKSDHIYAGIADFKIGTSNMLITRNNQNKQHMVFGPLPAAPLGSLVSVINDSNDHSLAILNDNGELLFGVLDVDKDKRTALGTMVPLADFHIQMQTVQDEALNINDSVSLSSSGLGIGTKTTAHLLQIAQDNANMPLLRLSTLNGKEVLSVSANTAENGRYVTKLGAHPPPLTSESAVTMFVPNTLPLLVSDLNVPFDTFKTKLKYTGSVTGFQTSASSRYMWLGQHDNGPSTLLVGAHQEAPFTIQAAGVDILTLVSRNQEQRVGLFQANPKAQFHLSQAGGDYLNVTSLDQSRFHINLEGQIGIGTQNPTALLDVAGVVQSKGIIAGDTGSSLVVPGVTVASDKAGVGISLSRTLYESDLVTTYYAWKSASTLTTDVTKNIAAYSVSMRSQEPQKTTITGVFLDTLDLKTKGTGGKYAAVFYGKQNGLNRLDSKVVIDLLPLAAHVGSSRMLEGCESTPGCIDNVRYPYQLTVFSPDEVRTPYVAFSAQNETGTSLSSMILRSQGVYEASYPVSKSDFVNVYTDENTLNASLDSLYNYLASTGVALLNADNKVNTDVLSTYLSGDNTLNTEPYGVAEKNVLAVLASSVTQNISEMHIKFKRDSERLKTLCINATITSTGTFNCAKTNTLTLPVSPAGQPHSHYDVFPLVLSTGKEPQYLSFANRARLGINIATSNGPIDPSVLDTTFMIGSMQTADPRLSYANQDNFIQDNGYSVTMNVFINGLTQYLSVLYLQSDSPLTNFFADHDQHAITVIENATTKERYMSYKTRFQDMRLGQYLPYGSSISGSNANNALFFSGGPCFSILANNEACSENNDQLTLSRKNSRILGDVDAHVSNLMVELVENHSALDVAYEIGSTEIGSTTPETTTYKAGFVAGGREIAGEQLSYVGIGGQWQDAIQPESSLHVRSSDTPYVGYFQDASASFNRSILNLSFKNATIEYAQGHNFVSFYDNKDVSLLGQIEGSNNSDSGVLGVQFSSPGRDYAEYVKKMNIADTFKPGDVVGIFGGLVSHKTIGADSIMVISSAPIVVGNYPGEAQKQAYALVAFLGQVPVRVTGNVNEGDLLVASTQGDGTAYAVNEAEITHDQLVHIVGRAWESTPHTDDGLADHSVNTLVGFSFQSTVINKRLAHISTQIKEERQKTAALKTSLEALYKRQQALHDKLKAELAITK